MSQLESLTILPSMKYPIETPAALIKWLEIALANDMLNMLKIRSCDTDPHPIRKVGQEGSGGALW